MNARQLEDLLNRKLVQVIETTYSEYEPDLLPLADGTVKDGLIDTGDMLSKSFFVIEIEFFPPKIDIVLNTTEYFKWVDGGTINMDPRNVLNNILNDPEVKEMVKNVMRNDIILKEI